MNEIKRPTSIRMLSRRDRRTTTESDATLQTLPNLQLRRGVHAIHAFVIHEGTFAAKQHVKSTVAEATPLGGKIAETLPQLDVIGD